MITEKISVTSEKPEELVPDLEIVRSSREQASLETVQAEKEKDTGSKEEVGEKQLSEERSVKQIIAPDIPEIDTGLLLTSVTGETTVPFKEDIKMDLPEERSGDRDYKKESEDTEDKSLTGHAVNKLEIKKYLDLPAKEEDRKRDLEKGTGDEKKNVKMEEATDEYYKKEDVLPKASPFFEKLREAEEKEVEIQEKAEVKVEVEELEQIQTQIETETKEKAEVRSPQEIDSKAEEVPSEPLIERIIDTPFAVETERSGESYQEDILNEVSETEDKESVVADVSISETSRIPSQEKYASTLGEKEELMTAEIRPELQESIGDGEKEPSFGISIPDVLFTKDIKIEISMNDFVTTEVSFQLMKKAHPLDEKGYSSNQKEIKLVEDTSIDYTLEYKRVFSTSKAEKGIYIFVMKNNGSNGYEADVLFHIFEGKSGERKKEYKTIELPPNTTLKYKFIIPEAVFWDDEKYFTGTIESSNTLTKFNEKTGLIWKEEKDQ
jgi:hypothetical protein